MRSVKGDYQDLVDEISALLGAPATLEDRDFRLIAFGAHDSDSDFDETTLDPVRTRSILTRRSTAEVRAWFEKFGIATAESPVYIPADPAAGVLRGRLCLPVRHRGTVHGYVWLLAGGDGPPAPVPASAMAVCARIGALLADEARARADLGPYLLTLLVSESPRAGPPRGPHWARRWATAARTPCCASPPGRSPFRVCARSRARPPSVCSRCPVRPARASPP